MRTRQRGEVSYPRSSFRLHFSHFIALWKKLCLALCGIVALPVRNQSGVGQPHREERERKEPGRLTACYFLSLPFYSFVGGELNASQREWRGGGIVLEKRER